MWDRYVKLAFANASSERKFPRTRSEHSPSLRVRFVAWVLTVVCEQPPAGPCPLAVPPARRVLGQRPVGDRVRVWVKPAVLIRERPAGRETKTPMQYTSVSSRSLLQVLGSQRHYKYPDLSLV